MKPKIGNGSVGSALARGLERAGYAVRAVGSEPGQGQRDGRVVRRSHARRSPGQVTSESTPEFRQDDVAEFHGFIARVYTVLPRNA